jgi:SET domain-containing protein
VKLKYNLVVKKSTVPNSGLGLFTLDAIKKNKNIVNYTGEPITEDKYAENPSGYGIRIRKGTILDAVSTQSCLGRYANTCKSNNIPTYCGGNNAKFSINNNSNIRKRVNIKATKNIDPGSEIFVAYGESYGNV